MKVKTHLGRVDRIPNGREVHATIDSGPQNRRLMQLLLLLLLLLELLIPQRPVARAL